MAFCSSGGSIFFFWAKITTRQSLVSSQDKSLIDFFWQSPSSCTLVRPCNKAFKRMWKPLSSHSAGKHKTPIRGPENDFFLWGCLKVKIINVDSKEALHAYKGGRKIQFGSTDLHSMINLFKERTKRKQHGSREGEGVGWKTGLTPARVYFFFFFLV